MSETVSALSDLLNSGTVTAIQAADRAEKLGIHLPYGTIAAYWSGSHGRPSARTLKALAQVVPFAEERLQRAAWNTSEVLGPWVPPEESALLDKATRKALNALIKSVVAAKRSQNDMETAPQSYASGEAGQDQKTGGLVPREDEFGAPGGHPRFMRAMRETLSKLSPRSADEVGRMLAEIREDRERRIREHQDFIASLPDEDRRAYDEAKASLTESSCSLHDPQLADDLDAAAIAEGFDPEVDDRDNGTE